MVLYKRCQNWKTLPVPGGVMAQPATLMEYLEHIHERVLYWQQKRSEEQRGEVMKAEMKAKL